jgi:hypothetical protein
MLTKEEQSALNVIRNPEVGEFIPPEFPALWKAERVLTNAILRLYPPGWSDPVTPERLVELGGKVPEWPIKAVEFDTCTFWFSRDVLQSVGCYNVAFDKPLKLMGHLVPRNMKEVRELLERCGAIKETK